MQAFLPSRMQDVEKWMALTGAESIMIFTTSWLNFSQCRRYNRSEISDKDVTLGSLYTYSIPLSSSKYACKINVLSNGNTQERLCSTAVVS
jgi:hypothetical protein